MILRSQIWHKQIKYFFIIFLLFFSLSFFSNLLALNFLPEYVVFNQGVGLGFFSGIDAWILVLVRIMFLVFLFIVGINQIHTTQFLIAVFLGAGTSNLLEFLFYGAVIDWLNLFGLRFNLADVFIVTAVIFLIYNASNINRIHGFKY